MPKPFPFPLQIGTDICNIARIGNILRTRGGRFVQRLLRPEERSQCHDKVYKPLLRYLVMQEPTIYQGLKVEDIKFRNTTGQITLPVLQLIRAFHGIPGVADPTSTGPPVKKDKAEEAVDADSRFRLKTIRAESESDRKERIRKKQQNELDMVKAAEFLAGRFAAKEAVIKAHSTRALTFQDISITSPEWIGRSRAPIAIVLPESGIFDEGQEVKISISHDAGYATASCIAFETPLESLLKRPTRRRSKRRLEAWKVKKTATVDVLDLSKKELDW